MAYTLPLTTKLGHSGFITGLAYQCHAFCQYKGGGCEIRKDKQGQMRVCPYFVLILALYQDRTALVYIKGQNKIKIMPHFDLICSYF